MAKYICKKKCFWRDKLWDVGEPCEASELPNKHFESLADVKARHAVPSAGDGGGDPSPDAPRTLFEIGQNNEKLEKENMPPDPDDVMAEKEKSFEFLE